MIADMSRAQDVKAAVTALKNKGARQAEASWRETVLGLRSYRSRCAMQPARRLRAA